MSADTMAAIDAHRAERYAELEAAGYDLSDTYTDQEGCLMHMDSAVCPRCGVKSLLSYRLKPSGYFDCPECGVLYDEPVWKDAGADFITNVDEED